MPTATDLIALFDQRFRETWYNIKSEATDQVLRSTAVSDSLRKRGCFDSTQVGGAFVTRTARKAQKTVAGVTEGDSINGEITELDVPLIWNYKNAGIGVVRNTYRDRENQGEDKISDYVANQIEAALDASGQYIESTLMATATAGLLAESPTAKDANSLFCVVPIVANRTTGTFGGQARPTNYTNDLPDAGNTWWSPKYRQTTNDPEVTLESEWRTHMNNINDQTQPVDLIITTQTLFETYEEFITNKAQLIKSNDETVGKLGYSELYFKEAAVIYSRFAPTGTSLFLCTPYLEVVRDPSLWMEMGDWVQEPKTERRQANILMTWQLISDQLRRHGLHVFS